MRKTSSINIGLLLSMTDGIFNQTLMQCMKTTAAALGINIFQYCNGGLKNVKYSQLNIVSELINPKHLDGLIIADRVKTIYISQQEFENFCHRFDTIPLITIDNQVSPYPCIISNFYNAAYGAFQHLIEVHKCKNIAFMLNSQRSMFPQCVQAFIDIHNHYGIPIYEDRIIDKIPPLKKDTEFTESLLTLIDKKIQALVTFDKPAHRCVRLLTDAGLQIPEDIAIMGLNNLPYSKLTIPPLTTMDKNHSKLGAIIIENMLKLINGEKIARTIHLQPKIIIRRSCGCFEESALESSPNQNIRGKDNCQESFLDKKETIKLDLLDSMVHNKELENDIDNLLSACDSEIQNPGRGYICQTISEIMKKQNPFDNQLYIWHNILSHLINWATPFIRDMDKLFSMQKVWQQSRLLISDRLQYHQGLEFIQEIKSLDKQRTLSESLSMSNNKQEILESMVRHLPVNDIAFSYLIVYDNPKPYSYPDPAPEWSWLIFGFWGKEILDTGENGMRFRTKNLIPEKIWKTKPFSGSKPFYIIIEGLFSSNRQIGYILFGISGMPTDRTFWLQNIISTSLQRFNFYKEIQKQTTKIQDLNKKLNKENLKMKAELKVVKHLQRMILPVKNDLVAEKKYEVAVHFKPSYEIGGDYYDIIVNNNRIFIGIGDVTGHGLESGVIMIMAQTAIRSLIFSGANNILDIYRDVNQILYENIKNTQINKKLTLLMAELDNNSVRFIGFHDDPFVTRYNGSIEIINTIELGTILGAVPKLKRKIKPASKVLNKGDSFILYTDGITEALGKDHTIYTETRLQKIVSQNSFEKAEQIKNAVMTDLVKHTGKKKYTDDTSLLVIKKL